MFGIAFTSFTGCAWLGNRITPHSCMYGGTHLDLMAILYPPFILDTYGLSIPLGLIDLPASFIMDTFTLEQEWGKICRPWTQL